MARLMKKLDGFRAPGLALSLAVAVDGDEESEAPPPVMVDRGVSVNM
eukprot:gene5681-8083_t